MRFKRLKVVSNGDVAQVTGYTYSGRGRDVLIGSIACVQESLKEELVKPANQTKLGLDLLKSK